LLAVATGTVLTLRSSCLPGPKPSTEVGLSGLAVVAEGMPEVPQHRTTPVGEAALRRPKGRAGDSLRGPLGRLQPTAYSLQPPPPGRSVRRRACWSRRVWKAYPS